jgi:His-Xaa-Ser system protein HxsD
MKNIIKFNLDLKIYPLEVIYQTCYVFLDKVYIFLDISSPQKVSVVLRGKKGIFQKQLENLKGEFYNELLNSCLRAEISKQNKKIREVIIGRALFSAIGGKAEKAKNKPDFEKDELGIAVPWEEKNKKKAKKTKNKKRK